ncbi:MAG: thermonuclease family protein [Chloroflexi bacterium]|nr:thermonuclease family protein [Chloroflexota bacterium]
MIEKNNLTRKCMRKFINFWNGDLVNKLLVIVSVIILGAVVGETYVLTATPAGERLVADLFPTSDNDPEIVLTGAVQTLAARDLTATVYASYLLATRPVSPTTGNNPQPTFHLLTLNPPATVLNTETPTTTYVPALTSTPDLMQTATLDVNAPLDKACIPQNPPQTGKAVEVIDGNTMRVLMDGLVFTIRYIGVEVPKDTLDAKLASIANSELVYAKDVTLISGASDKDERGRLLRYVLAENKFINLEIIRQGMGFSLDSPPNSSCLSVFMSAEQFARTAQLGMWMRIPTP